MTAQTEHARIGDSAQTPLERGHVFILLLAVGVAASCAIVYELIIASTSSYLLGNGIYHFSVTIGLFMSSMGIGSFLSKFVVRRLVDRFILVEVGIGLLGGVSAAVLFGVYVQTQRDLTYFLVMYGLIVAIGALVGLEIPVLTRIMRDFGSLRVTLANVLTFDYIGALVGSLAFPLILLKTLGLVQTGFVVGFLNVLVGGVVLLKYWHVVSRRVDLTVTVVGSGLVLAVAAVYADTIGSVLEARFYVDDIVAERQSEYQRIVVTRAGDFWPPEPPQTERVALSKRGNDLRLYIDGQLQFSSVDEYRYHEALVHPAMSVAAPRRSDVLILGGGDGLAARDVLTYDDVRRIVLVDIDPAITELCATNPEIVALNEGSLTDPRVTIVHRDAFKFVETAGETFDVIIVDLPDPNHDTLSKLYSVQFYRLAARILRPGGALVTQSTSPYFARAAFWCVHRSMEEAGLHAEAYHLDVPSMGDWGFNLATHGPADGIGVDPGVETLYLTPGLVATMFEFGRDSDEIDVRPNTLLRPILVSYYNDARWGYY